MKKKRFLKVVSIILAISLCVSSVPVFAHDMQISGTDICRKMLDETVTKQTIVALEADGTHYMLFVDTADNNTHIFLYNDLEIISHTTVNRISQSVTEVVFNKNTPNVVNEIHYTRDDDVAMVSAAAIPSADMSDPEYIGTVRYQPYIQGYPVGYNDIDFSLSTGNTYIPAYNFAGNYANIAGLVGVIIAVFSLPEVIALVLAKNMLAYAGLALGVTSFTLGTLPVRADCYICEWTLRNPLNTSMTEVLDGYKYVFTIGNSDDLTQYDGFYYTENNFRARNTQMANGAFSALYPSYDQWDIISWSFS